MRTASLLVSIAVLLIAAEARDDEAAKELQKLQGTWVLDSGEKDGQKLADEDVKRSRITWKGSSVSLYTPHQSKQAIRGEVTVDTTKRPHHMDWVRTTEPGKGQTMHAVYELLDEDHYRVCFAPPDKDRPTEFSTKPGSGHIQHIWKRVKQ
jgi:uncharacterized protein (TIGR03067 family)